MDEYNEYKIRVIYGDKPLVKCMEEVLCEMIRKYDIEMEKNIYIDRVVELMAQLDEKHQFYAAKILETLIEGWLDKD